MGQLYHPPQIADYKGLLKPIHGLEYDRKSSKIIRTDWITAGKSMPSPPF